MTRLRVAIRVPVGRPLPDVAAFVARCEDAGFDGVGIHDHPSSGRDAYLALALAAKATQRIRLFPATSSPVVRHPLVLASLAHSLEEIAPARTYLTVAPGFISTRSIGQPRAGLAFMREAVRDLRLLPRRQHRLHPLPPPPPLRRQRRLTACPVHRDPLIDRLATHVEQPRHLTLRVTLSDQRDRPPTQLLLRRLRQPPRVPRLHPRSLTAISAV